LPEADAALCALDEDGAVIILDMFSYKPRWRVGAGTRRSLRRVLLNGCLCALGVLSAAGCTIAPAPGSSAALPAQVLPADARALVYGRTVSEVIQNPELRDKIPGLFGADWLPASQGRGQFALGAAAFFEKGGPLRMVNVAGKDYVAVTGCVANACRTRRVLLLIGEGGSQLLARLDDAQVPHYYAYGSGGAPPPTDASTIVDAGLRALESAGDAYPSAGS
jgi:hypothetical protein